MHQALIHVAQVASSKQEGANDYATSERLLRSAQQALAIYDLFGRAGHAVPMDVRLNRITCLARVGDHARAREEWESLASSNAFQTDDRAWPACARILASLSSTPGPDANAYAELAMSFISRVPPSLATRLPAADLAGHPAFVPLRKCSDFAALE